MNTNTQSLPTIPSEKFDQRPNLITSPWSHKLFFSLIIITILIALGVVVYQNLNNNNNTKDHPSPTDTQIAAVNSQHEKLIIYSQIATVFVIGGSYYDSSKKTVLATNSAEFYTSGSESWTYMPAMNRSRNGATAAMQSNKIYVFGGQEKNIYGGTSTVEQFDPNTNKWTLRAEMPHKRQFANAVTLNEEIYVFGGYDTDSNTIMDIYNPSQDTWRSGPAIPINPMYLKFHVLPKIIKFTVQV